MDNTGLDERADAATVSSAGVSTQESSFDEHFDSDDAAEVALPDVNSGDTDTEFKSFLSRFAGFHLAPPGLAATTSPSPPSSVGGMSFTNTVAEVKRQQKRLHQIIDGLEAEVCVLRDGVHDSLEKSKGLLARTQESIVKERKVVERQHEITADSIQSLEHQLKKAQRDIAVLQAQHIADKGLIDKLANEINALWSYQSDIGGRIEHTEECEAYIRLLAGRVKDLLDELGSHEIGSQLGEAVAIRTLADEMYKYSASGASDGGDDGETCPANNKRGTLARGPSPLRSTVGPRQSGQVHDLTDQFRSGTLADRYRYCFTAVVREIGSAKPWDRMVSFSDALVRPLYLITIFLPIFALMILMIPSFLAYLDAKRSRVDAPIWEAMGA
ncbi:hypothetical protein C8Q78DRAFT_1083090 [Trametes maxima]|nr:hypothetical protein C8Q78DRAFT_1083090 [Trametes maxima]